MKYTIWRTITAILLLFSTASISMGNNPEFLIEYEKYPVTATNIEELKKQFTSENPSGYAATAIWEISIGAECNVVLVAKIKMPEHVKKERLTGRQRAEWERFTARLMLHESTHIHNGKSAAREVVKYNCHLSDLIERYWRLKDRHYDLTTAHGKTEGVFLNWNIGP